MGQDCIQFFSENLLEKMNLEINIIKIKKEKDGAIFQGYKVTPYYDSMICKLICHGRNRLEAIQRMNRSLDEFVIEGITTTIPLHKRLLNHKKFIDSDFNVSWLDNEKLI